MDIPFRNSRSFSPGSIQNNMYHTKEIKVIGVIIKDKLIFKSHINDICNRASRQISSLKYFQNTWRLTGDCQCANVYLDYFFFVLCPGLALLCRDSEIAASRATYPLKLKRDSPATNYTLRWRHYGCDSVSNHQPRECLLRSLIRRTSKKTSKLRVTGLCAGNSPETGEFPAQMASNAENVSIWWRHHACVLGTHLKIYNE